MSAPNIAGDIIDAILSGTPDKRSRRTKAQISTLEAQIHEVLREDHPQSVRHVFYRMTNPRLSEPVEKTDQGYAQVQHRITKMRRNGQLPYSWITDATRRGYHVETFNSPEEFIRQTAHLYRHDLWSQADHYVEVWVESRSLAGVIQDECATLAVSLYPAGGFASIALAHEAAAYIAQATDQGSRPAEIIYIGDLDPAGVLIDVSIERELRTHLGDEVQLNFHRIAITAEQVAQYDLPTRPRKATDRRSLEITEAVEAEAMPASIMREMLREKIESFLPPDALSVTRAAEESERNFLFTVAQEMGGEAP